MDSAITSGILKMRVHTLKNSLGFVGTTPEKIYTLKIVAYHPGNVDPITQTTWDSNLPNHTFTLDLKLKAQVLSVNPTESAGYNLVSNYKILGTAVTVFFNKFDFNIISRVPPLISY